MLAQITSKLEQPQTIKQRLILTLLLGYLGLSEPLPASFPSALLLSCFQAENFPEDIPHFFKTTLKTSFRLLFLHNIQYSTGAEWVGHIARAVKKDIKLNFLRALVAPLPIVARGVLLRAYNSEALNDVQRVALGTQLIPSYGDIEDVIDIFMQSGDSYILYSYSLM